MKLKIPSIERFILYVELFLVIYQSGTVQASMNSSTIGYRFLQFFQIVILLIYAYKSFRKKGLYSSKVSRKVIVLFCIVQILAVISFINSKSTILVLEYKIFLFFHFLIMITYVNSGNKKIAIENSIYDILILISFITMIFYFIIEIVGVNLPYTIFDGGLYEYKNYFGLFYNYHIVFPARISGLFWEPGVNQIYANLALYLYIKLHKKKMSHFLLLIIEIVFTRSMMGYIIMTILLVVMVLERGYFKGRNWIKAVCSLCILSTIIIICLFVYKMKTTGTGYLDSYTMRSYDLVLGLKLFAKKPIFGFGYMNTSVFHETSIYQGGSSNGLLTWMYTTGLAGTLFALFPFLCNLKVGARKDKIIQICWIIIIILCNIGEPIFNLPIMVFIVAYEYSKMLNISIKRKTLMISKERRKYNEKSFI